MLTHALGSAESDRRFHDAYTAHRDRCAGRVVQHVSALPLAPPRLPQPSLTDRQQQVAELVADGLTDRQIASRLGIARRTAESHVRHILARLGAANRAQVAAWVARQQG